MNNLTREEICGPYLKGEADEEQEEQEESVPASWTHPGVPGTVIAHLLLATCLLLQVSVESICFRKVCAGGGGSMTFVYLLFENIRHNKKYI